MKHYSEAELLETYYLKPCLTAPVMLHLSACSECSARYDRLEKKLRSLASCDVDEKPQTFWTRQRMLIMRGIDARKAHTQRASRSYRVAAAAVLAFFLGGVVVFKTVEPELKKTPAPVVVEVHQPKAPAEDPVVHDAWQSDELREFHGMVQWETWDDAKNDAHKGSSL
ncbi:MAG TPA: hypothetical protein VG323_01655 [Thermoanaerobaculia bacterium]|nr:hypothetical protein [Thermoanaerobaculia bacterium]